MTTTADKTTTVETWLYAGERVSADGKKHFFAWCDPSGEILHYRKVRGSMPGHAYAVEVHRDDETIHVYGTPRYLGEQSDREATATQLDTWRAEHAAARARQDGDRLEKQAADDDELERALEVLHRHHGRLRSYVKRGAFQAYVLGEIQRPAKQRDDDDA